MVAAGFAGYLLSGSADTVPPRLLLANSQGHVVFTHKAHSTPGGEYGDIACAVCHHDLNMGAEAEAAAPGTSVIPCKSCHSAADDPSFKEKHQELYRAKGGDASCASCHHRRMEGLSDKWDHGDHIDYAQDDCTACHHPERFEFKPGEFMDVEPQACANCHSGKPNEVTTTTLKVAAHTRCESCHSDLFEDKLAGCATCHAMPKTAESPSTDAPEKDVASCATCHDSIPGNTDAFHQSCMGCHDKTQKGPGSKAPCAQCHTP